MGIYQVTCGFVNPMMGLAALHQSSLFTDSQVKPNKLQYLYNIISGQSIPFACVLRTLGRWCKGVVTIRHTIWD
jgi:hypothetical protein